MKWKMLLTVSAILLLPAAHSKELETLSIVTVDNNAQDQAIRTIVSMDEQSLERSFIAASSEIGQLISTTTTGVEGEFSPNFKLEGIDVEFSFGVSGGFVLFSSGIEGGVVLHYTKKEL
ncbi:MAG: hypothetical protein KAG61_00885 [Bacteriovoracaceae bacterium]|nr:hypothetical protein [Bacteriovoracaceae bacterium]